MEPTARIRRRIEQDFPLQAREEVSNALARYGEQPHEREPERVQLAVLILADGNLDKIAHALEVPSKDYRDVPPDWIGSPDLLRMLPRPVPQQLLFVRVGMLFGAIRSVFASRVSANH